MILMSANDMHDRRRVSRIPVDTVLYYRAEGMDKYEMGDVTSVSVMSLELLTDSPLSDGSVVTVAVRSNGSPQNSTVIGAVIRRERLGEQWLHIIKAPGARPWSPLFLCRVICSTFNLSSVSVEAFMSTYGNQKLTLQNMIRDALRH